MSLYILILCTLLYGITCSKTNIKLRLFYATWILMFLMCALRADNVGTDTLHYIQYYSRGESEERYGPLYDFLRFLSSIFGDHANVFLSVLAACVYAPLLFIIKKYSRHRLLSLLVFAISLSQYFLETFNLARQSIAIVLGLLGMCEYARCYKLKSKQTLFTLLIFFTAFLAHKATCVLWPFLLIAKLRISKKIIIGSIIVSIIIGLSGIMSEVNNILLLLQQYDSASVFSVYSDININSELNVTGLLTRIIPISILCILLYPNRVEDRILYNFFFFGVILINILMQMSLCVRFASSLTIIEIILIPQVWESCKSTQKLGLQTFLAYECLYYLYSLYSLQSMQFLNPPVPYKLFF